MKPATRYLTAIACVLAGVLALPAVAGAQKPPDEFYGVIPQEPLTGEDYARIAEANVGTVRIPFDWPAVQYVRGECQPTPQVGVCNWAQMDSVVGNLAQVGARVMPILYGSPSFISKKGNKAPLKGAGLEGWRAFLHAAAARYGRNGVFWQGGGVVPPDDGGGGGGGGYIGEQPRGAAGVLPITDWQVWNEPNSAQFWHGDPDPRKYAAFVRASANALRAGDPMADVVLGGMFADAKLPIVPYMNEFYRVKGIDRSFDDLAIHPYAQDIKDLKRQIGAARKAARKGTAIRVTEIGWSSRNGGHRLNVGTDGQAEMLSKAFRLLTKNRRAWNISGINWFALRDTTNKATCRFCLRAGLLKVDGRPKPAWSVFTRFSAAP
jgi:hypothetical protein